MGRYHEAKRRRCGHQLICNGDDLTLNLGGCRWLSCTVGKYGRNRRKQVILGLEPELTLHRLALHKLQGATNPLQPNPNMAGKPHTVTLSQPPITLSKKESWLKVWPKSCIIDRLNQDLR